MTTVRHIVSIAFVSLFMIQGAFAQEKDSSKVSFAYDLDFQMQFDNREFYRSNFTPSMTIFGARVSPYLGIAVNQNKATRHRFMAGITNRHWY